MNHAEITGWLRESDPERLSRLWRMADDTRRLQVGEEVHLRGLIEISNVCLRQCAYCGLRAGNRSLARYRMSADEIFAVAGEAVVLGYGTVVLQAGEDDGLAAPEVAALVRRLKQHTPLAVTLSLGERLPEELAAWREAGADRYLLRFETSDPALFRAIHPPRMGRTCDRFALLRTLRELGYEVGSGIMVGLPGQSYDSVASDLLLFRELDLDMIGIGPFIPHPATPLGTRSAEVATHSPDAVPADELTVGKAMALARLLCPQANIPSTSALATINPRNGRELGLQRGGNVVMPNLTPLRYRRLYEIYPGKACVGETSSACNECLRRRIEGIGRTVGRGQGGRRLRSVSVAPPATFGVGPRPRRAAATLEMVAKSSTALL